MASLVKQAILEKQMTADTSGNLKFLVREPGTGTQRSHRVAGKAPEYLILYDESTLESILSFAFCSFLEHLEVHRGSGEFVCVRNYRDSLNMNPPVQVKFRNIANGEAVFSGFQKIN